MDGIVKTLRRLIGEDIELAFIPGEGVGRVRLDPVQMEQILMNLAANSRDAMPQGGRCTIETCNVRLDEQYIDRKRAIIPAGRYAVLTVTDTGTGIPANDCRMSSNPLHHETFRQRHRAWVGYGVRHRQAESWIRLGL